MKIGDRIDELFQAYCGPSGGVELRSVFKLLWAALTNAVSLVDLAGVFAISIPGSSVAEVLSQDLFQDFFRAFSRLKFPTGVDYCERLIDEIRNSKVVKAHADLGILGGAADKSVVRVLLKYDLPLRRAFSAYCSQSIKLGSMVSWEEVRSLSLGMELDGFISFCGAYSIIPQHLSTQQCEIMFREVLSKYPLVANAASLGTSILYPQFQLLLAMIAIEKGENQQRKNDKLENKGFAKKNASKLLSDSLQELFRDIGISKFDDTMSFPANYPPLVNDNSTTSLDKHSQSKDAYTSNRNLFTGTVIAPSSDRPEDMYHGSLNHARQSMLIRMEHLFDEVESKLVVSLDAGSSILQLLSSPGEEILDGKARLPTKPVVIGDALPIPADCPDTVDQLLEAALAHHNLGSFEESLKFLEAARIQLTEILQGYKVSNDIDSADLQKVNSYFDVQMYIAVCKGNVYQSCGDDEQSLIHYMDGWSKAKSTADLDWEIVCINAIGMLAFFSLRYEVALLCFHKVHEYRDQAYGQDSPDTATALNNEACSLYCLNKRGESRLRFEKSWNALTKALGHRSPRAVTVWKNLEKARRSHLPLQNKKDMKESIEMRPDSDRLIMGGTFTIQALAPPEPVKKKKGGGKKKKK